MGSRNIKEFIYPGSPFIPGIYEEIVQEIVKKRYEYGKQEPMEFTLAQELRAVSSILLPELLSKIGDLNRTFGTLKDDLPIFLLGFDSPLYMITMGYMANFVGDRNAITYLASPDNPKIKILNEHIKSNLSFYKSAINMEPSGRTIFLNEENHPCFNDLYYLIGAISAKCTYIKYAQSFGADFS